MEQLAGFPVVFCSEPHLTPPFISAIERTVMLQISGDESEPERASLGIPGLDDILGGGITRIAFI